MLSHRENCTRQSKLNSNLGTLHDTERGTKCAVLLDLTGPMTDHTKLSTLHVKQ